LGGKGLVEVKPERLVNKYIPLALFALFMAPLPFFISNYEAKILVFAGINAILAMGLCLLMGYAGQISLGHAAFFGVGAYTSAILTTKYGMSIWLGFFAAIVLSALVALIIGIPSLRLKGHYLAMATLGFGEIMSVLFTETDSLTNGPEGIVSIPPISIGKFTLVTAQHYYYFVWGIAILLLAVAINIIYSRVGRALRALHGGEIAAQAMGVNTAKYKIQIFVLSAVYGGIAGSLYAHFVNFINPSPFTLIFSIVLVLIVVLGGTGRIWGAVVGALVLTLLPEYLRVFQEYNLVIYALILILVMIFMPQGLVPGISDLVGRLRFGGRES
jgi:branched-chain amino acid transport system permease protein